MGSYGSASADRASVAESDERSLQPHADEEELDLEEALKAALRGELRCRSCGYGVVARDAVPRECPMCHESDWEAVAWRPFSRLRELAPLAERLSLLGPT